MSIHQNNMSSQQAKIPTCRATDEHNTKPNTVFPPSCTLRKTHIVTRLFCIYSEIVNQNYLGFTSFSKILLTPQTGIVYPFFCFHICMNQLIIQVLYLYHNVF